MGRLRTVLIVSVVLAGLGGCASVPPPAPLVPPRFDIKLLAEGEFAALPPLGVVLVRGSSQDATGTTNWQFANDMKMLTIPEGALLALGIRSLARPEEIAWARSFLASDIEAPGSAEYDPKRAMGWMELMRSGRFDALVQGFAELCAASDDRELQAVEKSLLDAARVWLVAEIAAVEMVPPDAVDTWLISDCTALVR